MNTRSGLAEHSGLTQRDNQTYLNSPYFRHFQTLQMYSGTCLVFIRKLYKSVSNFETDFLYLNVSQVLSLSVTRSATLAFVLLRTSAPKRL